MVFVLIGVSAHPAWFGLVLGWLLLLPWFVFTFLYASIYAHGPCERHGTMDEEYVRTARAKGVAEAQVLRNHGTRDAPASAKPATTTG